MTGFYSDKYNENFYLLDGEMYIRDYAQEDDEPVDWDIINEDEEMAADYRAILNTLLKIQKYEGN